MANLTKYLFLFLFIVFGFSRILLPDIVSITLLSLGSIFLIVDYGYRIFLKRQRGWFNVFWLLAGCTVFGLTVYTLITGKFLTGKKISYTLKQEQSAANHDFWDALRNERDQLLKAASDGRFDQIKTTESLLPLWEQATQHVYQETYAAAKNDKNHFTQTMKGIAEYIQDTVNNMIASNALYSSFQIGEIGVLDLSLSNIPESILKISYIFPLSLGPNPHDKLPNEKSLAYLPDDVNFLRRRFPNVKYIVFFDPLFFPNLAALEGGLGHELAHITQPYHSGIGEGGDIAINRLAEIDADIKNICLKQPNGLWVLRKNSSEIIENFCTFIEATDARSKIIFDHLTRDLTGDKKELVDKYFKPLLTLHFLRHPIAAHRKFIMTEFILTMKDFGGAMTDEEFNAAINIIATLDCIENNIPLSDEFLKLVDLDKAKKLPKIAKFIKIPTINKVKN